MKKMTLDYSKIKPLSVASHDTGMNGRKVTDTNPSEWAWTIASFKFPRGTSITIKKFREALDEALVYEALSIMVDEGKMEMCLDNDNNIAMRIIDE
jgi:hypothetical protein